MAIVVMSGDFVQRGVPAIMPKHLRTEAALRSGASLVLELPVCYATGSAEIFALGAVSLLDKLGCVDYLCFGSECGDLSLLEKLAKILSEEPDEYRDILQSHLRLGDTFPLARQNALEAIVKDDGVHAILEKPNNILGLEYLKALYRLNSTIKPVTVQRAGSGYHDTKLGQQYSSASAIRTILYTFRDSVDETLEAHVPLSCFLQLKDAQNKRYPVQAEDFSLLLKYKLLKESKDSLTEYADVSQDLANRIINQRNHFMNFHQFCDLLKTKEMTYTRISRALIHILLEIKKCDFEMFRSSGLHAYIRVLGFRKDSSSVLTCMKQNAEIPLLTKLASTIDMPPFGHQMLQTDMDAANLYESVITDKFQTPFVNEYEQALVRI